MWNGTVDGNNNPTTFSVVPYSAGGQKLGTYQLIPGTYYSGGNYVPFIGVSVASSDQYFGGRRLAAMDQLGSAGTYYPWGEAKGGDESAGHLELRDVLAGFGDRVGLRE